MMLKIQLCDTRINYIFNYVLHFIIIFHNISYYCISFYCILDHINAALMSLRYNFYRKKTNPKFVYIYIYMDWTACKNKIALQKCVEMLHKTSHWATFQQSGAYESHPWGRFVAAPKHIYAWQSFIPAIIPWIVSINIYCSLRDGMTLCVQPRPCHWAAGWLVHALALLLSINPKPLHMSLKHDKNGKYHS